MTLEAHLPQLSMRNTINLCDFISNKKSENKHQKLEEYNEELRARMQKVPSHKAIENMLPANGSTIE